MKTLVLATFFFFLFLINPQTISAHAFGQLYNLPVPFWMYLYGTSAAIVLSFLIIGLFVTNETDKKLHKKTHLPVLGFMNTF